MFYATVFCTKVLCAAFLLLHFGFRIFGDKILYKKQAHKTVMKLTPGVNFINILGGAFSPIFLCQKISKLKCN
jgi:hypothetical protein